jgi:hypothetical protein
VTHRHHPQVERPLPTATYLFDCIYLRMVLRRDSNSRPTDSCSVEKQSCRLLHPVALVYIAATKLGTITPAFSRSKCVILAAMPVYIDAARNAFTRTPSVAWLNAYCASAINTQTRICMASLRSIFRSARSTQLGMLIISRLPSMVRRQGNLRHRLRMHDELFKFY